jgi:hypothetical protein
MVRSNRVMKKYKVYYSIAHQGFVEVKADSNMEAEDIVWDMLHDDELSEKDTIDSDYQVDLSMEINE